MSLSTPAADAFREPLHRLQQSRGKTLSPADADALLAGLYAALAQQEALRRELHERNEKLEEVGEELRRQLVRYRELFEFAPDAYLVTDRAGLILENNVAAAALLNVPQPALRGQLFPLFIHEADRRRLYALMIRAHNQEPGSAQELEVRLRPGGGTARVVALSVLFARGLMDGGTALRWLLRDVTARREAEEAVRRAKEFAEGLIETAQAPLLVLDGAGAILRANPHLEGLTGQPPGSLRGKDWVDLLVPEPDRDAAREFFRWSLASPDALRRTQVIRTRDGRLRTIEWASKRLTGPRGEGRAVLLVGHDLTELQEAQERALRLERLAAIGQMATGLAHESRNALQRGQACLEMIRLKLQDPQAVLDWVDRAQAAQLDLLRLYEDVREYAAALRLSPRPADLGTIWRQAWAEVVSVREPGAAEFHEDAAGVDLACVADGFRLGQVFRNLFENALAACPTPARVEVRCRPAERAGRPALEISVRDNGPGFTDEQKQRVFEPFYTTKVKGTGLGLPICRRILEAHGGTIHLADRPGPGAEFVLTLPREGSRETEPRGAGETAQGVPHE